MEKNKKSVLVVDDENSNIMALTHILGQKYNVYAVKNGLSAIDAAKKYLPDVILLDIVMPEMDGYAVITALKNSKETQSIPVIFITGLSNPDDEEKGLALGAADYIPKPFSPAIVKLRVHNQIKMLEALHELEDREKMLEAALEQAAAASKAKGEFLSTMSHEMRTPMNAIIGMTAIGKKAEAINQKNQALNKIGDASSHLLGVINDVLDMAKIEANKMELAPTEYHFERMLEKMTTVISFRIDEKQQQLTVNVDGNIPRFIVGDEQRLAQVVTNLMSNAVKFTPPNGTIKLNASLVGETDDVCELRIEVIDSGIGISPEKQAKIFQAFEQAESGTSREYGGTGLGLVISKRIVELMEGKIWVESELGKGANFIFTVKARRSQRCDSDDAIHSQSEKTGAIMDGKLDGKRMLLAEDVEINREILVALLEDTKIIIDCAENGKDALEMATANADKYDIVFMDVQMPRMDGHEAARQMRNAGMKLPIIAMTANVFKEDIDACLAAGMDGHLGKPLDIDKVLETLHKYLC
ncbi:MAG: response regulator [Chitinispirillales bacterium]|jgi:signal transduction histidine kinase|nr:response regulator [Chitinispirillales bacterium]